MAELNFGYNNCSRFEETGKISFFVTGTFVDNNTMIIGVSNLINPNAILTLDTGTQHISTGTYTEREVAYVTENNLTTHNRLFVLYRLNIYTALTGPGFAQGKTLYTASLGAAEDIIAICKVSDATYTVLGINGAASGVITLYTIDIYSGVVTTTVYNEESADNGGEFVNLWYKENYTGEILNKVLPARINNTLYFMKHEFDSWDEDHKPYHSWLSLIEYNIETNSYTKTLLVDTNGTTALPKFFGGFYGEGGNFDYSNHYCFGRNKDNGLLCRTSYTTLDMDISTNIESFTSCPVTIYNNGIIQYGSAISKVFSTPLDPWWFIIGTLPYGGQSNSSFYSSYHIIGYTDAGVDAGYAGDYRVTIETYPVSNSIPIDISLLSWAVNWSGYIVPNTIKIHALESGNVTPTITLGATTQVDAYPIDWSIYDLNDYSTLLDLAIADYTLQENVDKLDSVDNCIYFVALRDVDNVRGLLGITDAGAVVKFCPIEYLTDHPVADAVKPGEYFILCENFLIQYETLSTTTIIMYLRNYDAIGIHSTNRIRMIIEDS